MKLKSGVVIAAVAVVSIGAIIGGANLFLHQLGGDARLDQLVSQETPTGLLAPMSPELSTAIKLSDEGDDENAEEIFRKLMKKVEGSDDSVFKFDAICAYGDFLSDRSRYSEAAKLYGRGAEMCAASGKKVNQAIFLGKQAMTQHMQFLECGSPKPDLTLIKKVNDLLDHEVGAIAAREHAVASVGLAMVYVDNGKFKEADDAFDKAAERYTKLKMPARQMVAHLGSVATGRMYSLVAQGRYKEANEAYLKAVADYPEAAEEVFESFRRSLSKKQMASDGLYPTVRELLLAKRFDDLERLVQQARADVSGKVRGKRPNNLCIIYQEMNNLRKHDSEDNWKKRIAIFEEWVKSKPDSDIAKMALADVTQSYAWKARGGGYANTVSDEGWKLFEQRLDQSQKLLEQTKEKPPEWYKHEQTNALGQGWENDRYDALVAESQAKYPNFDEVIYDKFHRLQPRWHGEPGEAEAYLEKEANKRSKVEGDMLYARTVAKEERLIGNVLYELKLNWLRIKDGFIALKKAYPDDVLLRGQMSGLAMQANDKATAATAFDDSK